MGGPDGFRLPAAVEADPAAWQSRVGGTGDKSGWHRGQKWVAPGTKVDGTGDKSGWHRGQKWVAPGAKVGGTGGESGWHRGQKWMAPGTKVDGTGGEGGWHRDELSLAITYFYEFTSGESRVVWLAQSASGNRASRKLERRSQSHARKIVAVSGTQYPLIRLPLLGCCLVMVFCSGPVWPGWQVGRLAGGRWQVGRLAGWQVAGKLLRNEENTRCCWASGDAADKRAKTAPGMRFIAGCADCGRR